MERIIVYDIIVMKYENKPHYIFLVFTYEAFCWSEDFDIVLEAYNTRSKETIIRMFSCKNKVFQKTKKLKQEKVNILQRQSAMYFFKQLFFFVFVCSFFIKCMFFVVMEINIYKI